MYTWTDPRLIDLREYVEGIDNGSIPACLFAKQAVRRFLNDLNRTDLEFRPEYVLRVFDFFKLLTPARGELAGKPIELVSYQKFIVANLYGFYWTGTNRRRFTKAYVELPRKSGKSLLSSGLCLYALMFDGENGPQVYTAATQTEQAKIVFKDALSAVQASPILSNVLHYTKDYIEFRSNSGLMRPMSSETKSQDGFDPSFCSIDEYHAHKTDEVYEIYASGMDARMNPMIFTITTAGFNLQSPCYQMRKTMVKLLDNIVEDDSQFTIIYTIDEGDEWDDIETWKKVNPAYYSGFVNTEGLKNRIQEGKNMPWKLHMILTKNLNIWVDSADAWIDSQLWRNQPDLADFGMTEEDLLGMECYAGLDLAAVNDMNALVLAFPLTEEDVYIKPFFWITQDSFEKRCKEVASFRLWRDKGLFHVFPGNGRESQPIIDKILELSNTYKIKQLNVDPKFGEAIIEYFIMNTRINCVEFPNVLTYLTGPTLEFDRLVRLSKLHHSQNEVMNWMVSNAILYESTNGSVMPDKKRSADKMDGVMAAIMALASVIQNRHKKPRRMSVRTINL